jgi:recombinational DNA repair protein RecR
VYAYLNVLELIRPLCSSLHLLLLKLNPVALPGIGPKTAQRLAFHTLDMKEDDVVQFAKALVDVKRELIFSIAITSLSSSTTHITERSRCLSSQM